MPEGADQPWLRLDNPATSGGGHHKKHCEKYNRDTPGWLLAHSLGRQPGQGGSIPEYAAALHSSQPSGSATVEVGLARGKGAWVFLQPLLGWSLLLGVAEQPFPSRKVPWPSAVAKNIARFLSDIPPLTMARHCLQLAPGTEGWQVVVGTLLPGMGSFHVPSGLLLFPWMARSYLRLGLSEEQPDGAQPAFVR